MRSHVNRMTFYMIDRCMELIDTASTPKRSTQTLISSEWARPDPNRKRVFIGHYQKATE